MTLVRDALTVMGKTFGGPGCDYYVDIADGISGLGQPARSTSQSDRSGGGLAGGTSRPLGAEVGVEVWVDNEDIHEVDEEDPNPNNFESLLELRGLMLERPDPSDYVPLSWAGLGWPGEHRLYVRPETCRWLTDATLLKGVAAGVELLWLGDDPVIYSEAETEFESEGPATSQTVPLNNAGTRSTLPGRALQVSITASGGTVVNPFIENTVGGVVRRTTWRLSLGSGQTLALDTNKRSRIGSQGQDGRTRGNGPAGLTSSPTANWPLIPPGESELVVGCQSGAITVVAKQRSTW